MRTPTATPLLAACFALAGGAALAQAVPFSQVDADGDSALSQAELVDVFGEANAELLLKQDTNGDGVLSEDEIMAASAPDMADDTTPEMADDMAPEMADEMTDEATGKTGDEDKAEVDGSVSGDVDGMTMGAPG